MGEPSTEEKKILKSIVCEALSERSLRPKPHRIDSYDGSPNSKLISFLNEFDDYADLYGWS